MKGILKNTTAGWFVWYNVMRDEITSGYDSLPLHPSIKVDYSFRENKEVEFEMVNYDGNTKISEGWVGYAKLIATKEEPKQENCCTPEGQIKRYVDCKGCDRKPKEETLEEAAKKYATNHGMMAYMSTEKEESFIEGAKWRQERMYSEDEVIEFTMNMISQYVVGNTNIWDRDRLKESLKIKL